jgi:uncharacterized membrane protein HdeD (DUF308 family)
MDAMPPKNAPDTPPSRPRAGQAAKTNSELLQKGILLVFIGLAVLIGPQFMAPSGVRDMVASSALVGWFALVLGGAFGVLYALRRRNDGRP